MILAKYKMADIKNIQTIFKKLYGIIKSAKDISEEDLRVEFVKSGILKELGYKGELEDIRFEKSIKGKRSDLLAFDDHKNVNFVVEFKKALDLEQDFVQLWERYVKPLKARFWVLTDGQELLISLKFHLVSF
jgi:Zn/Cd-binding protein ZinT